MTRNRKTESIVYAAIWVLITGIFLLDAMQSRAVLSLPLLDIAVMEHICRTLCPYLLLFVVSNYLLIPYLLLRNKVGLYFVCAGVALLAVWGWQYVSFMEFRSAMPPGGPHPMPHHGVRPLLPLPLLLDFTYGIVVIGVNLAVTLMFQRYYDRLEHENLMKTNAESQLTYLKAQINPHFYMNMLNNIHGMIEIDTERAQGMVIDMSNLMRYMLYESSHDMIPLVREVAFLQNYLRLMRQRYPENKVAVTARFPDESAMAGVTVPPLLFLVFVENAFKHGVSYRAMSNVEVTLDVAGDYILFTCINTLHPSTGEDAASGIGLKNVSRRLDLIYGPAAALEISNTDNKYSVRLTVPAHETKNSDN